MVPPPLNVPTCKIGELHFLLGSCVPLLHLLRHEETLSDGRADEPVGSLSFLGDQAPQNRTGKLCDFTNQIGFPQCSAVGQNCLSWQSEKMESISLV